MPREKNKTAKKNPTPKDFRSRVIAITGVNGFIGANILQRLQARGEHKLIAIDIKRPNFLQESTLYYRVDMTLPTSDQLLLDIFNREGVDTVLHFAFLTNPIHNTSNAHELEVIGTLHLLTAAAQAGVQKVVIQGTTMAYGAEPMNPNFLTEQHKLNGARSYSYVRDKVEMEYEVARFAKKYPDRIITVLRLCTILGPTVRNYITGIFTRNIVFTLLGYDPLFQLIHEEDALNAIMLSINENHRGIFNIAGRGVLPLSTLLKIAGKINIPLAHPLAKLTVGIMWMNKLSVVPGSYLEFIKYPWVADTEKAANDMGFHARYSTRETMEHFIGVQRLRNIRLVS